MTQGEVMYLVGVIAAFLIFGVTLAALTYGEKLPSRSAADAEAPAKPTAVPVELVKQPQA